MSGAPLLTLPFAYEREGPRFEGNAIRYPESLVRHFLKTYTKRGQRVFDPFAGLGTTLFVAEEMGRIPFGIEADEQRHAWSAGQLKHWQNLLHADAAKLPRLGLPKMDFCITSPPFMAKTHKWNPLHAGNPKHAGYDTYLRQMARIFAHVAARMRPGGLVVVQVDNIAPAASGRPYTPLVRDMGNALAKSMTQTDEIIVQWDKPRGDYTHTHCLVFKA